jgi:hypothetical protein
MSHFLKPFFRPARGLWCVQLQGKQIGWIPKNGAMACLSVEGFQSNATAHSPHGRFTTPISRGHCLLVHKSNTAVCSLAGGVRTSTLRQYG